MLSNQSDNHSLTKLKREHSLDFLRGFAVLLMILTHVIVLFYQGASPILNYLVWLGAATCFTIFLFVFAAIFGLRMSKGKLDTKRELKRSIHFLIGYYFVVLWVQFFLVDQAKTSLFQFQDFLGLITLANQPEYTEFIVSFIFYIWLFVGLKKIFAGLLARPALLIFVSIGIFMLSQYLYSLNWGSGYINVIKGQLVGHSDWHTFGVLSYFPVFSAGLIWGHFITKPSFKKPLWSAIAISVLVASFYLLRIITGIDTSRWPPSFQFLIYGMIFSFIVILLYNTVPFLKHIERFIDFAGKNVFSFYLYHLLLLMPLQLILSNRQNETTTILLILLTLSFSSFLILFLELIALRTATKPSGN